MFHNVKRSSSLRISFTLMLALSIKSNVVEHGCTTFSLLPAALRLFLWITPSSDSNFFKNYFALLLVCFHTLGLACFHTLLSGRLSTKQHNTVDKEFILMHDRVNFHRRPQVLHPWSGVYIVYQVFHISFAISSVTTLLMMARILLWIWDWHTG